MADAVVQLPLDSTGKMLDMSSLTVGANTVHRQRLNIADPTAAAGLAAVANGPPAVATYGLVTRNLPNDFAAAGSLGALNAAVTADTRGMSSVFFAVIASVVGTLVFEVTPDGTNWFAIPIVAVTTGTITTAGTVASGTTGIWTAGVAGTIQARLRVSAYTSGTATAAMDASPADSVIGLDQPLPTGANTIGAVNQGTAGSVPGRWFVQPTDGSFVQSFTTIASVGTAYQTNNNAASTVVQASAASGSAATATVPAGGAGVTNYIAWIQIDMYAAAALTGGGTPILVTTTGISGTPSFTFATAAAIGAHERQDYHFDPHIKGTAANTAATVVAPATTNVIWRVTVGYHTGP